MRKPSLGETIPHPESAKAYKIVNNFLESSGENILFGGGPSADTAGDIEIRRNHLYKPMSWNPASPTFAGVRWVVKNHLELKNAGSRPLEGNVFENVWGGFSQFGAHVLLTPKNQAQRITKPLSQLSVTQVTFVITGFSTGSPGVSDRQREKWNGAYAKAGSNYSIHDNVAENIAYRGCYGARISTTRFDRP